MCKIITSFQGGFRLEFNCFYLPYTFVQYEYDYEYTEPLYILYIVYEYSILLTYRLRPASEYQSLVTELL